MKTFLATVLAILTLLSMSACTSTKVHELLDKNGELKGYVKETLETLDKYCTKLEFMDENKNVTHTINLKENEIRFNWGVFDDFADRTPFIFNNSDCSLNGVVYIFADSWDAKLGYHQTLKEYYTYPCSGQIMEEYELAMSDDGSFSAYTSVKLYNEDGSVKFSFAPTHAKFFNTGIATYGEDRVYEIREYNSEDNDICYTYYDMETLEFIAFESCEQE